MAKVTNISNGPRGAYNKGVLVMADPGQTIDADDYAEEWFGVGGFDSMTKAELTRHMDESGIAYETDDNKADLLRKIAPTASLTSRKRRSWKPRESSRSAKYSPRTSRKSAPRRPRSADR